LGHGNNYCSEKVRRQIRSIINALSPIFAALYIFTAEKGDEGESPLHLLLRGKLKQYSMSNTTIKVNNNGSLRIEGDFQITDKDGNVYDLGGRTVVSLCRCGRSANKPFVIAHTRVI
jgi:hypothetical protein